MEEYQNITGAMIIKAMGKTPDCDLSSSELKKLEEQHCEIIADISIIAPNELEAFLALNTCCTYEHLAKLIAWREQKKLSEKEYNKFLVRLRTRAHRGREKVVKMIRQIYQTEE